MEDGGWRGMGRREPEPTLILVTKRDLGVLAPAAGRKHVLEIPRKISRIEP